MRHKIKLVIKFPAGGNSICYVHSDLLTGKLATVVSLLLGLPPRVGQGAKELPQAIWVAEEGEAPKQKYRGTA